MLVDIYFCLLGAMVLDEWAKYRKLEKRLSLLYLVKKIQPL
ncbi:hypothetical protein RR47_GL000695 [Enterococcus columbae DSM 7374 = ATCC 51263]|nr:hypothetical protein RR47_GL000695 [Enterococcus columbae DSM 7374 = ATCC 51263]